MTVGIITNTDDAMNVPNAAWAFILKFARRSGWSPSGTIRPDWYSKHEVWNGAYDPAMGQSVGVEDARSFAKAIVDGLDGGRRDELLTAAEETLKAEMSEAGYTDVPAKRVTDKTISMLRHVAQLASQSSGFRVE